MHRTCRTMAALAAAAALTVAGLSPASAARWSHDDAVGDVMGASVTWEELEQDEFVEPEYVADPDNLNTDVTRLAVRHSSKRLRLQMSLRDIDGRSGFAFYFLRAGERRFTVMQKLGRERGVPAYVLTRANGKRVRCAGIRNDVDRTTEQAVLGLPRRCLGRPAWVRVSAASASFHDDGETLSDWYDLALLEGDSDRLGMSPRIKRA